MKKVKIILICGIVVICSFGGVLLLVKQIFMNNNKNELTTVEKDQKIVTESVPTLFVMYGDKLDFAQKINVKYVEKIDRDELILNSRKYSHEMIIINNLNGQVHLSDDEWNLIKDLLEENVNYSFFYLGANTESSRLADLGIIKYGYYMTDTDLSVGMVRENGKKTYVYGTYTVEERDKYDVNISELLIHELTYSFEMIQSQ